MRTERIVVGALETNCWVVSDGGPGPAIVIDPGADPECVLGVVGDRVVAAIVLTHGHFDHLGGVDALLEATGAPLLVHADDAERLTNPGPSGTGGATFGMPYVAPPADRLLADGDRIEAGALVFRVLHTPGHTPGGIALYVSDPGGGADRLFAGDTVFAGSVGRTDFPGGNSRALSHSIAEKIAPLPASTIIHPGHGPDTTVGREARINPFWPRG